MEILKIAFLALGWLVGLVLVAWGRQIWRESQMRAVLNHRRHFLAPADGGALVEHGMVTNKKSGLATPQSRFLITER